MNLRISKWICIKLRPKGEGMTVCYALLGNCSKNLQLWIIRSSRLQSAGRWTLVRKAGVHGIKSRSSSKWSCERIVSFISKQVHDLLKFTSPSPSIYCSLEMLHCHEGSEWGIMFVAACTHTLKQRSSFINIVKLKATMKFLFQILISTSQHHVQCILIHTTSSVQVLIATPIPLSIFATTGRALGSFLFFFLAMLFH